LRPVAALSHDRQAIDQPAAQITPALVAKKCRGMTNVRPRWKLHRGDAKANDARTSNADTAGEECRLCFEYAKV